MDNPNPLAVEVDRIVAAVEDVRKKTTISSHPHNSSKNISPFRDPDDESGLRPNIAIDNPILRVMINYAPVTIENLTACWKVISLAPYREWAHLLALEYLRPAIKRIAPAEFDAIAAKYPMRDGFAEFVEEMRTPYVPKER